MPTTLTAENSGDFDDKQFLVNAGHSDATDWQSQRNATSYNTATDSTFLTINYSGIGKSSSQPYTYRSSYAFSFNSSTTGIPTNATITGLSFKFTTTTDASGFSYRLNTGSVYIAKGTYTDTSNSGAWNDMDGWVSSGSYEGEITKYADSATSVSASTTHTVTLNSTAISDGQACVSDGGADQYLKLMVVYDDDWLDSYSISGTGLFVFNGAAIRASEDSDGTKRPQLVVQYTVGGDDAIFFGTIF